MSKNIFEIAKDYNEVMIILMENEGELTPELEERLNMTSDEFEQKIIKYKYFIDSLDGDLETINKEIERLKKLKDSKTNLKENIKDRVKQVVSVYGSPTKSGGKSIKLDTISCSISDYIAIEVKDNFRDNRFKIGDIKKLPANIFIQIKDMLTKNKIEFAEAETIDKTKLNNYIKDNPDEEIEGIEKLTKQRLSIK